MVISRESKLKDGGLSLSANDVINYIFKMAPRLIKSVYTRSNAATARLPTLVKPIETLAHD